MNSRSLAGAIGMSAMLAWASAGSAQPTTAAGKLYRLTAPSDYQEGCFAPCMCPLQITMPLRGTFRLSLVGIGNVTDFYRVNDARLSVIAPSVNWSRSFTGSGDLFIRIASANPLACTSDAVLTLTERSTGATYNFDGGPDANRCGLYPPITLVIDRNNQYCYDQVLRIVARPMSADWDLNGSVTVQDLFSYLADWFASDPSACYHGGTGNAPSVQDLFDFVADWFVGTP